MLHSSLKTLTFNSATTHCNCCWNQKFCGLGVHLELKQSFLILHQCFLGEIMCCSPLVQDSFLLLQQKSKQSTVTKCNLLGSVLKFAIFTKLLYSTLSLKELQNCILFITPLWPLFC